MCVESSSPLGEVTGGVKRDEVALSGQVDLSAGLAWAQLTWWGNVSGTPRVQWEGRWLADEVTGRGTAADPWTLTMEIPLGGLYAVGYAAARGEERPEGQARVIGQFRQGDFVCPDLAAGRPVPAGAFLVPPGVSCKVTAMFGETAYAGDLAIVGRTQVGVQATWVEVTAWTLPTGKAPVVYWGASDAAQLERANVDHTGNGTPTNPWRLALIPPAEWNGTRLSWGATLANGTRASQGGAILVAQVGGDGKAGGAAPPCLEWREGTGEQRTYVLSFQKLGCEAAYTSISQGSPDSAPFEPGEKLGAGNVDVPAGVAYFGVQWSAEAPEGTRPFVVRDGSWWYSVGGNGTAAEPWRFLAADPPAGRYQWGVELLARRPVVSQQGIHATQASEGPFHCIDVVSDLTAMRPPPPT